MCLRKLPHHPPLSIPFPHRGMARHSCPRSSNRFNAIQHNALPQTVPADGVTMQLEFVAVAVDSVIIQAECVTVAVDSVIMQAECVTVAVDSVIMQAECVTVAVDIVIMQAECVTVTVDSVIMQAEYIPQCEREQNAGKCSKSADYSTPFQWMSGRA